MKKMNKKGFTLAELLIVVAVIAVLTAIAVPLFVGALDGAEEAVFNSNRDVVRSAGIVKVVGKESDYMSKLNDTNNTIAVIGQFTKKDGKWVLDSVSLSPEPTTSEAAPKETTFSDWKGTAGNTKSITVHLTATDLTK